ncbi:MAG: hypothetical protein H6R27_392 [Proteobacteria bacterium]|nr:hypothetical protein [Pseudomonadota bacterium]
MRSQAPLALPPPAGPAHWEEESPLGVRVTAALASANAGFLSLAASLHAARPGMPALGLPAHVLAGIARLEAVQQGLVLPLALYDIRFRDERYWRHEIAACGSVHDGRPATAPDPGVTRFTRTAVTLAWHFAQSEARAARLALGMEAPTQQLLASLPVGALDALAQRVSGAVAARFCTRERFWGLVTSAVRFGQDTAALERLRLLGLQLQGADSARVQQLHRRLRRTTQA